MIHIKIMEVELMGNIKGLHGKFRIDIEDVGDKEYCRLNIEFDVMPLQENVIDLLEYFGFSEYVVKPFKFRRKWLVRRFSVAVEKERVDEWVEMFRKALAKCRYVKIY